MKRKEYIPSLFAVLLSLCSFCGLLAQTAEQKLRREILSKDSLFWVAYNTCDTTGLEQFFTPDVEFYHDKGGMTSGVEALINNTKKNLCANNNFRLRREAVEGSINVFPLQKDNIIYGAVLSGSHVFYIVENGKGERLDGLAKFTHVWLLKDSSWKMARILSYDHGPAPYRNKRKEIKLSNAVLAGLTGTYKGQKTGLISVRQENGLLVLLINHNRSVIYPESGTRFFMKDRDVVFEFVKNKGGRPVKMLVLDGGEVAEEAMFVK
jgi:hypothetical protein